jgi:hypothetical protein
MFRHDDYATLSAPDAPEAGADQKVIEVDKNKIIYCGFTD